MGTRRETETAGKSSCWKLVSDGAGGGRAGGSGAKGAEDRSYGGWIFFFFILFVCLPVLRQGLFTQSGVASNPRHFSCLSLPSVEMIGVRHHAWLELVLKEGVQLNGTLSQSKIYVHSGIHQRLSV